MFGFKAKKEELNTLNKEIEKAKEELKKIGEVTDLFKAEVELDIRLKYKRTELEKLEDEVIENKKKIDDLKLQYEEELKVQEVEYKKQIDKLKEKVVAEKEVEIERLNEEIYDKIDIVDDLTRKIEDLKYEFECEEKYYEDNRKEFEELKQELKKTKVDVSKVKKEREEVEALREEKAELEEVIESYHKQDVINISEVTELPKFDFANSSLCKDALKDVRNKQEVMLKDGTAVISSTEWTVGGSKVKGRKMVNDTIKMMIKSFNSGCDHVIGSLKYNTYYSSLNKIERLFAEINRLNATNQIFISNVYKRLKIDELDLAFKYAEMKEEEKEEQRIIREQMREEAKRREELENMRKKIEKEQKHYENELARALEKQEDAELIRKLREKIAELENGKKDVEKAEATVKAGYVYIISNEGSFGEDVYKIGTTRRLNPFDRVDELGNASVPFRFDVHAMIFSEDCFELETKLHKIFDAKRVNKVNKRKEFFNVSLDEIVEVVNNQLGLNVEFTLEAIAKEYKESRC